MCVGCVLGSQGVTVSEGNLERYLDVIYLRCCRLLRDEELARDALQDIFLSFYERMREATIEKPLHYLYRSSTNHCLNLLRRYRRPLPMAWAGPESSVTPSPEAGILVEQLAQEFGGDAIQLMIYRYVDQMTYEEIGQIFERSDRAIKKRLDRLHGRIDTFFTLNP